MEELRNGRVESQLLSLSLELRLPLAVVATLMRIAGGGGGGMGVAFVLRDGMETLSNIIESTRYMESS